MLGSEGLREVFLSNILFLIIALETWKFVIICEIKFLNNFVRMILFQILTFCKKKRKNLILWFYFNPIISPTVFVWYFSGLIQSASNDPLNKSWWAFFFSFFK